MGLILYSSEIQSLATKIRYYLDSIVSCYSQAEQVIQQFADNEKLNSLTWKESKEAMYVCYQLIVQGILNVQQDISDDLEILEMNIGDEILIEDDLNRQIEALEMEIQSCQENIDMWTTSKMVLITGWIPCTISINSNNEKINLAMLKKAELEAKLQKLHDIEAKTATLLLSAIDFIRVVRQAISDGGIVLDGGEVSPYADWMTTINTKLLANNVDEINSAVEMALGMEMDQLQELYGKDAITQMKYAWNQELMQHGELSKESVIICMVQSLYGYNVEALDGKYQISNKDFILYVRYTEKEIVKLLKEKGTIDSTPEIVSKEQLEACGLSSDVLTYDMLMECNKALDKYGITDPNSLEHLFAQIVVEVGNGEALAELGKKEYFEDKSYTPEDRGGGYIQLTHDYAYQAFAIYLILDEYPDLNDFGKYRSPSHNSKEEINEEYQNILAGAEEKGIDITKYTNIYNYESEYVAENYAWEATAYFWSVQTDANEKASHGATVDEITDIVNFYDGRRQERRDEYKNITQKEIFR